MKCAEYYLDNHKIEIHYSLFGTEWVLVNGRKISEQRFNRKKPHRFVLGKNTYDIFSRLAIAGPSGRDFDVFKNGNALSLVNFRTDGSKALLYLTVVLGMGCGYVLGSFLYQWFPADFGRIPDVIAYLF